MNHHTPNHITCLLGLVTIAALAAPRPAGACESVSLERGLKLVSSPQDLRQIAGDGVLAFDAFIRGEAPEVALARFSLTLTPEGGGPAITGETSHRTLASQPYDLLDDYHEIVLVWRPAAPLAPGSYTADVAIQEYDPSPSPPAWSFPLVVDAAPAPPLSAPQVAGVRADVFDDEELERVCCEVGQDSCGHNSFCEPTRVRIVPGFTVSASLEPADIERAYLWVAPWDGQAPGPPFERMNPWRDDPLIQPWWSEWTSLHPIRLPDAAGQQCIVVGATSLIDGSVALAEPICAELTAAYEEPRTPTFPSPDDSFARECLTPPVYEHDGSPYPPEPERGCRLAGSAPGPLLLLLLVGRRRRRVVPATAA